MTKPKIYSKCSKILNTFLFLFSNKSVCYEGWNSQYAAVRIANREDPDQTASSEAVSSGSHCLSKPFLVGNMCSKF